MTRKKSDSAAELAESAISAKWDSSGGDTQIEGWSTPDVGESGEATCLA